LDKYCIHNGLPNFKNGPKTGLRPLGVKDRENPTWQRILDAVGCSFALLRRVCWPKLEECYVIEMENNQDTQKITLWQKPIMLVILHF
jgi:hypothetical protein